MADKISPQNRVRVKRPIRIEGDIAFVPLTRGYEAVIDAVDIPLIERVNWRASVGQWGVYAVRSSPRVNGKQRMIFLHRVLLNAPSELEVDHVDGDALNNSRSNLRLATRAENSRNLRRRSDNSSGLKGIGWHKAKQRWQAQIQVDGRKLHLGLHDTPEAAHAAYVEAAHRLHGEFARVA